MTTNYLDNFYARLGISKLASQEEIRDAYHRAAKRLHPDTNDTPAATELFLQVQEAYETLSNQTKRSNYDSTLPEDIQAPPDIMVNTIYSRDVLPISESPQLIYLLLNLIAIEQPEDQNKSSKPALNICLVLDTSTSMGGKRLDAVKATASNIIKDLTPQDYLSVISFNDHAEVIIPANRGADYSKIESRISMISAKGGTEIYQGLHAGLFEISKNMDSSHVNHLILITDGRTYGDENESLQLSDEAKELGVTISCLGIGQKWHAEFLDQIATKTGGTSFYASDPQNINKIINDKFEQLKLTYANNVYLEFNSIENIELRYVFRMSPDSSALDMANPLKLGNIPLGGNLSVLLEFYLPNIDKETTELVLAEGHLNLTIPNRPIPQIKNKISFSRPVVLNPEKSPPPQVLIKAMSKLSLYRMQEQARNEMEKGNIAKATTRLNNLAVQLLTSGNPDLAHTIHLELEKIKDGNSLSEEAEKQIKYGTRALVFPQEKTK